MPDLTQFNDDSPATPNTQDHNARLRRLRGDESQLSLEQGKTPMRKSMPGDADTQVASPQVIRQSLVQQLDTMEVTLAAQAQQHAALMEREDNCDQWETTLQDRERALQEHEEAWSRSCSAGYLVAVMTRDDFRSLINQTP